MASDPKLSVLVAVDTNFLLDLAEGREDSLDVVSLIRKRTGKPRIGILPTVAQEIAWMTEHSERLGMRGRSLEVAQNAVPVWHFEFLEMEPVQHGIAEQIARRLQLVGLLPHEEINDALIVAESAILGCQLLMTRDEHLRGMDFPRLAFELQRFDVGVPVITTPQEVIERFFR